MPRFLPNEGQTFPIDGRIKPVAVVYGIDLRTGTATDVDGLTDIFIPIKTTIISNDTDYGALSIQTEGLTDVYHGTATVATAGTAVQLSTTSTPIRTVTMRAAASNSGVCYVGNADIDYDTNKGFTLAAGATLSLDVSNLNKIYIDGMTIPTVSWIALR